VGFRQFCADAARSRGVRGWVRNRRDGSVELTAYAVDATLDELKRHLCSAHAWARVDRCEESATAAAGSDDGFMIRPTT
jgi:acylphosphatase